MLLQLERAARAGKGAVWGVGRTFFMAASAVRWLQILSCSRLPAHPAVPCTTTLAAPAGSSRRAQQQAQAPTATGAAQPSLAAAAAAADEAMAKLLQEEEEAESQQAAKAAAKAAKRQRQRERQPEEQQAAAAAAAAAAVAAAASAAEAAAAAVASAHDAPSTPAGSRSNRPEEPAGSHWQCASNLSPATAAAAAAAAGEPLRDATQPLGADSGADDLEQLMAGAGAGSGRGSAVGAWTILFVCACYADLSQFGAAVSRWVDRAQRRPWSAAAVLSTRACCPLPLILQLLQPQASRPDAPDAVMSVCTR